MFESANPWHYYIVSLVLITVGLWHLWNTMNAPLDIAVRDARSSLVFIAVGVAIGYWAQ